MDINHQPETFVSSKKEEGHVSDASTSASGNIPATVSSNEHAQEQELEQGQELGKEQEQEEARPTSDGTMSFVFLRQSWTSVTKRVQSTAKDAQNMAAKAMKTQPTDDDDASTPSAQALTKNRQEQELEQEQESGQELEQEQEKEEARATSDVAMSFAFLQQSWTSVTKRVQSTAKDAQNMAAKAMKTQPTDDDDASKYSTKNQLPFWKVPVSKFKPSFLWQQDPNDQINASKSVPTDIPPKRIDVFWPAQDMKHAVSKGYSKGFSLFQSSYEKVVTSVNLESSTAPSSGGNGFFSRAPVAKNSN